MEKQYLKRKLSNLIIIEGFWNVGKTQLANYIKNISNFIYIEEPNHLTSAKQKNVSKWYFREHQKRLKIAIKNLNNGKGVVMERSIISNISYQYAITGKISPNSITELKKIGKIKKIFTIVFLYGSRKFIKKQSKKIKDEETRNLILKNDFYGNYLKFYKEILPIYIKTKVGFIKIDNKNNYKPSKKITNLFFREFPLLEKERAICAGIVAFYKDKVLMLYDNKYKHYVLPQGHREKDETLKKTANREMIEETGFYNFKIIKKIKKYQYHYSTSDKRVYKSIHVYLLRIINLSRLKKSLEDHEDYLNIFFAPKDAIKNAKWLQDKVAIETAIKYIK